jgi:hypothetical protein
MLNIWTAVGKNWLNWPNSKQHQQSSSAYRFRLQLRARPRSLCAPAATPNSGNNKTEHDAVEFQSASGSISGSPRSGTTHERARNQLQTRSAMVRSSQTVFTDGATAFSKSWPRRGETPAAWSQFQRQRRQTAVSDSGVIWFYTNVGHRHRKHSVSWLETGRRSRNTLGKFGHGDTERTKIVHPLVPVKLIPGGTTCKHYQQFTRAWTRGFIT